MEENIHIADVQEAIVGALLANIMFAREGISSSFEKFVSMLNEAEAKNELANLHDGMMLMAVMEMADSFIKPLSDVKRVGIDSLPIGDYLFYKEKTLKLLLFQKRLERIPVCSKHRKINLTSEEIYTYSDLIRKASAGNDGSKPCCDFMGLYDEICSLYDKAKSLDEMVYNVIVGVLKYVAYEWGKVIDGSDSHIDVYERIERDARQYFINNRDSELKKLKDQTSKLIEECPFKLTRENWNKMKRTEDKALHLAIEGKLVEGKDECLVGYSKSEREQMENNRDMIRKMVDLFPYDELFNFRFPGKFMDGYHACLNCNNIFLFYRLVLRGSIIRCSIYPNLIPKFVAWINEGENGDEKNKTNAAGCRMPKSDDENSEVIERDVLNYVSVLADKFHGSAKQHQMLWSKIIQEGTKTNYTTGRGKTISLFEKNHNKGISFNKRVVHFCIGELIKSKKYLSDASSIAMLLGDDPVKRTIYHDILKGLDISKFDQISSKKLTDLLR